MNGMREPTVHPTRLIAKSRLIAMARVGTPLIVIPPAGFDDELRQDLRRFCYYFVTLLACLDGFLRIF